jgi:FkbM family methyltransferase
MNWNFRRPRHYRIGKFILQLTRDHALPRYQARFRTYDRFLPILAEHLNSRATVVDVGANVGDTVASMASTNPGLHFLAVEPDPVYLALLRENVEQMLLVEPNLSIEVVAALIADDLTIVGLEGSHGSRRVVVSGDKAQSAPFATLSLDDLLLPHDPQKVALIKTDTDGFDWSVIDSGREFFAEFQPMLYFECEVRAKDSVRKYSTTLNRLIQNGYVDFHVFDNFGGYLGRLNDPSFFENLMKYAAAQNARLIHRTLYYMDVLAVAQKHTERAAIAVDVFTRGYST